MKTEYKTELGKSYMVLQCDKKEDSFAMQMLEENHIRSLLPFERRCFNGKLQFFYDITGKCALADRAEKMSLGEKDVRRLLQGLYCVFEEIHSYFLGADGLLLQEEYIYEMQEKIFFCYCPSKEAHGFGIEIFAERLLDQIDNDDEEALQLAYEFYAQVKDGKKGILYMLEEILTKEESKEEPVFQTSQMFKEIPIDSPFVPAEEQKEAAKKPDLYMMVCFLLAFLCCFTCLFLFPASSMTFPGLRPVSGIIMVLSTAGMALEWTDIDIVRKK